ncbi:hypothetical protein [Floccifex sp.]|uniref:hypothetical protein n=1 Tax=Floccifex sp. TaxID=2815810 RepID=UPI002A759D76|nr:hypothetical protein [Floccifex sp.]MDD7281769.1 hypothetical protein [Erysipelotrichaceae bacterium]MDY2958989.1 hypothetical protein [Floccifex sp.]
MKKKCDYCDNYFDDSESNCPYCGAPNEHISRNSDQQPQTISELKQWYVSHNLPDEKITRFFIGKDVKEARCFGIYQDENSGDFIVYKNKDDGSRSIRYQGKDEKYAVNELYQRLRAEISNQKKNTRPSSSKSTIKRRKSNTSFQIIFALIILFMILSFLFQFSFGPRIGYYRYNGREYYYTNNNWYYYDDFLDDWLYSDDVDYELNEDASDYYQSKDYSSQYGTSDFDDSQWASDDSDFSSDWDNDSSWDFSDSWDSSSTDWSSDW